MSEAPIRVVVTEYGETPPDAIEHHVVIEPQARPDPAALGPRDVLIAVRAAQVGWVDLLMTSGQYQHMAAPPYCPGMEYSGEIVWVGSDVRRVSVGARVIADGFLVGPRSLGDYQSWGGFASYAVAHESALIPVPERLSYAQAASLLGGYETAYHCLIHRGRLLAGETVLIHGATGTTGLAAVHVARIVGATVIATGRSPDKLEIVAAEGAHHVVCTTADDGSVRFADRVKELTSGRGVDVVWDGVGGETSIESLRCVDFGARFLIVGWASTPFVAKGRGGRGAPNANVLPTNLLMMKSLDVLGCPAAISAHRDPGLRPPRHEAILRWVDEGAIRPRVAATFSLADVREAMRAKWESRHVGAVVVEPP